MKQRLLSKMEHYFGKDEKRINHARQVLRYAEEIMQKKGGDQEVIFAAAILHDIGIHAAERKYNSCAGKYQEIEGPPIAEHILKKVGFPAEKTQDVLEIIAHHHRGGLVTKEFAVLVEADGIVNRAS